MSDTPNPEPSPKPKPKVGQVSLGDLLHIQLQLTQAGQTQTILAGLLADEIERKAGENLPQVGNN